MHEKGIETVAIQRFFQFSRGTGKLHSMEVHLWERHFQGGIHGDVYKISVYGEVSKLLYSQITHWLLANYQMRQVHNGSVMLNIKKCNYFIPTIFKYLNTLFSHFPLEKQCSDKWRLTGLRTLNFIPYTTYYNSKTLLHLKNKDESPSPHSSTNELRKSLNVSYSTSLRRSPSCECFQRHKRPAETLKYILYKSY